VVESPAYDVRGAGIDSAITWPSKHPANLQKR